MVVETGIVGGVKLGCPSECYDLQAYPSSRNDNICQGHCEFRHTSEDTCSLCKPWCDLSWFQLKWCKEPSRSIHESNNCNGCSFCLNPNEESTKPKLPTSSSSTNKVTMCPYTFHDVTKYKFLPQDKYWYQWKHSGKPYEHEGGPLLVDLNNDGILDFFSSMHAHPIDHDIGFHRMEIGESVTFDFRLDNITTDDMAAVGANSNTNNIHKENIKYRFRNASYRIIFEDPAENFGAGIDPHGQNIVDLDGDGYLDIIIASGGNMGKGSNEESFLKTRDNFLFWGEPGIDDVTGQPTTFFRGGRGAAKLANVHMRGRRGRTFYFWDANGDGLLDMFLICDRRGDDLLTPGVLLINQGDRTWKEDHGLQEFTRSLMLTDANGDGHADELVINRAFCYPQRQPLGNVTDEFQSFCQSRPVGTTAIYKFDDGQKSMTEISPKYSNVSPENDQQPACCPHGQWDDGVSDCNAKSMMSGDFDNDLKADLIMLYESKFVVYLSSDRQQGQLPIGPDFVSQTIELPEQCVANSAMLVDLDNDGNLEMLILCDLENVYFVLYSQHKRPGDSNKVDWVLDEDCNFPGALKDLHNKELARFTNEDYKDACSESTGWKFTKAACNMYHYYILGNTTSEKPKKKRYGARAAGWALVDMNNDGFLDVVVNYNNGYLRFYQNQPSQATNRNRILIFELIGSIGRQIQNNQYAPSNRYAIGSTLILTSRIPTGEKVYQFREINSYQHHTDRYSRKDPRMIFGLGEFQTPISLEIRWPNGHTQVVGLHEYDLMTVMSTQKKQLKPILIQQYVGRIRGQFDEEHSAHNVWISATGIGMLLVFLLCALRRKLLSCCGYFSSRGGLSATHCKAI